MIAVARDHVKPRLAVRPRRPGLITADARKTHAGARLFELAVASTSVKPTSLLRPRRPGLYWSDAHHCGAGAHSFRRRKWTSQE
jgi:hypothetical protein